MFGRRNIFERDRAPQAEQRPYDVRIMELSAEDRAIIAQHRFEEFKKLIKASGCAIQPDPASLAINFHTGEHLMIAQVNGEDPRQISLLMVFSHAEGDLDKARWACLKATARQFASKAAVEPYGHGYRVKLSVGVYAEAAHAFGDSLKAYVDDVIHLYNDFVDLMISD